MFNFLRLPERTDKPRQDGLTILIDNGYGTSFYEDIIQSHAHLIDYIKFGWGTAYITKDIVHKIKLAKEANIKVFFGGTFFEKVYVQNALQAYLNILMTYDIDTLEISNGTIPMSNKEKCQVIKQLAPEFTIFSEVGYKDVERSEALSTKEWIEYIYEDIDAGADKVLTETRESGRGGICKQNGEVKTDCIEKILAADIDADKLIFEAPNKSLQEYFIKLVGANVNLANIAFQDIISVETLRLGLRADTLMTFE